MSEFKYGCAYPYICLGARKVHVNNALIQILKHIIANSQTVLEVI